MFIEEVAPILQFSVSSASVFQRSSFSFLFLVFAFCCCVSSGDGRLMLPGPFCFGAGGSFKTDHINSIKIEPLKLELLLNSGRPVQG
jgi:hypothetical protein